MIEYDLERLFEHPLSFRSYIAAAIIVLGEGDADNRRIQVTWRPIGSSQTHKENILIHWNTEALQNHFAEIEEEVASTRVRSDGRASHIEQAAIIVAVAVMSVIEPDTRFTRCSAGGTGHDYFLYESHTEMIEIAGRWQGGLPGLFNLKTEQSDRNKNLKKRWVSVTIFKQKSRNRTEGFDS